MIRIYMLLAILWCISCIDTKNEVAPDTKSSKEEVESKIQANNELTLGEYTISIDNDLKKDTANLLVSYKGKKVESFGYRGAISDVITGDINEDGNAEVYFTFTQKEQKRLLGMILSNGYPLEMYKAELDDVRNASEISYSIKNSQLVEKYKMKDSEQNKEIRYNLVAGEAGYLLKPEGWTPLEIKRLLGEYKKDGDEKSSLIIKKADNGEYAIEVESSQCSFSSIGYFLNKDFLAPLNFNNPNLKGKLNVRIVGNLAVVYTLEEENIKELSTFCKGGKSIAGTFIKK